MLHRAVFRIINRTVPPYTSLVKAVCRKYIIRKSSTIFKNYASVGIKSSKLDQPSGRQKLCTQDLEAIKHIKNAFCKELSMEDIGEFVQIRGIVVYIKKGHFIVIKDKTGSVRLVIDNKRTELMNWVEKLEKYSVVKVIGIVREKAKGRDGGRVVDNKEKFDIEVNYIISSLPPSNKVNEKILAAEEVETEPLEESTSTGKTITCKQINKKRVGKTAQVFGWIKNIDKGEKSFVLYDANGSVPVVLDSSRKDVQHEMQKLKIEDMVVVEGLITDKALPWKYQESECNKCRISANFIKKLNEDNFLELTVADVNRYTMRSYNCGELNVNYVGQRVKLMGWITFIRMNRFILLQDKYGLIQLTIPNITPETEKKLKNISLESVISVEGIVTPRPPGNENKDMATGEIEISVLNIEIINEAETLPFYYKDPRPARPTQLEYKYLDLRHHSEARMNLKFRSDMIHKMRRFLIERVGFIEVETPTLFRRSPGGSQEFIVPSRKKGEFYALVQSPQHFKQLLMIGGMDRYFQIARCYRDEDAQKDRQPEFTQLDIEISFCNREGIIQLMEDIIKFIWPNNFSPINFPFPRITYEEAMTNYGTDKPDLRFDWKIKDVTDIFKKTGKSSGKEIDMENYMKFEDFTALSLVAHEGMTVYSILKQFAEELAMSENCKIFAFNISTLDKLDAALNKLFVSPIPDMIKSLVNCKAKDIVFLGFGRRENLFKSFGKLRSVSAKKIEEHNIKIYDRSKPFSFLWVYDFPLFEESNGVIHSVHHPFSQCHPDDMELLETNPLKVRGLTYDLVLNGNEIGGGSIRIHDPKLQKKVIENILRLDTSYFQHLLKALSYGAPTHGGFALGIDRFIALLCGTTNIVDVIAFPKYSTGRDPLTGAPTEISKEDKDLYHIN